MANSSLLSLIFRSSLVITTSSLFISGVSYANCPEPQKIDLSSSTINIKYDPSKTISSEKYIKIKLTNTGSEACEDITIKFVSSGDFYLSDDGGLSKVYFEIDGVDIGETLSSASTRNTSLTHKRLGPRETRIFEVPIDIVNIKNYDDRVMITPGNYKLSRPIKIAAVSSSFDSGNSPLGSFSDLVVEATIERILKISIDNGGDYLNMGFLENGKKVSTGFTITSNTGHTLRLKSDKGGVMKGPVPDSIETHSVPYYVSIPDYMYEKSIKDNYEINFSGGTPPTGDRKDITFIIGDTSKAVAGKYKDILTLEVEANR